MSVAKPYFYDQDTNRRYANEQEGFGKVLSHSENDIPRCASDSTSFFPNIVDYRGLVPTVAGKYEWVKEAHTSHRFIEWETPPAQNGEECTFCFIMNTLVVPEYRPAYPYVTATFSVDGKDVFAIPLGDARNYRIDAGQVALSFEPRRFTSMTEGHLRFIEPNGASGIYRLTLKAPLVTQGKPVKLKVALDETKLDVMTYVTLVPRRDVLALSLATLRDEVAQLQTDLVEFKLAHAMLAAKNYPELFPEMLQAETGIAVVQKTRHMHPPTLCKYDGDNILITFRLATDHLSLDGACYAVRSFDKGKTWTAPEEFFDLGNSDHRSTPLIQIENGDLVGTDYRAGVHYHKNGERLTTRETLDIPCMWGVWSSDRGKTWSFSEQPVLPEGVPYKFTEAERPPIELPGGRLLMTAMYCKDFANNSANYAMGVWSSDDKGRSWQFLSTTETYDALPPFIVGEPTIIRCRSGKLVILMRSQPTGPLASDWPKKGMVVQCESYDEGKTWTKPHATDMPSMQTPVHLTLLSDGRLLATHASRGYPGSIYVTVSDDEGETWNTDNTKIVTQDLCNFDSTYPTSIQFSNGDIITTWYGNRFGRFYIAVARYGVDKL